MDANARLSHTLDRLKAFAYLGEQYLEDGTHLIGKAPHIAPLAWLHSIYPPLVDTDIRFLDNELKHPIPNSYREFLKITNGLNVFNTAISLYGLRKNYNRTINEVWQPFDIITPNIDEIPKNAVGEVLIIGSYDWDGSLLFTDCLTEKVYLCDREDITPKFRWDSLYQMLDTEINRLIGIHDREGKELFPDESTLPK